MAGDIPHTPSSTEGPGYKAKGDTAHTIEIVNIVIIFVVVVVIIVIAISSVCVGIICCRKLKKQKEKRPKYIVTVLHRSQEVDNATDPIPPDDSDSTRSNND